MFNAFSSFYSSSDLAEVLALPNISLQAGFFVSHHTKSNLVTDHQLDKNNNICWVLIQLNSIQNTAGELYILTVSRTTFIERCPI